MSSDANGVQTFLLSITILPQQNGAHLRQLIHEINDAFEKFAGNFKIVHKFKVSGEARIVAVVDVSDIVALKNFVETVWSFGSLDVNSDPLLHYETFARNIGAAEILIKFPEPKLGKDNLYWLELDIEYHGKTSEEFIDLWRREVEFVLTSRAQRESGLTPYKAVGQRKIHLFLNNPSVGELDKVTFQLPIMVENGHNIQIRTKRIQFLEDYTKEHP